MFFTYGLYLNVPQITSGIITLEEEMIIHSTSILDSAEIGNHIRWVTVSFSSSFSIAVLDSINQKLCQVEYYFYALSTWIQ